MRDNKVFIAFGFHVNCYHSYRGDTPDALGFGGDIRIIRHILDTLDDRNAKGIPVRGTWDFENAYSLEKILPEYAPDIIERVKARGDENILMGYNNGAMSAMTDDELETSISWAVTNPYRSGLKDVFGDCEMIIRPQEVMFTPTQVPLYNKLGVKAICLYYSCISFDAFRTLVPPLPDGQAFNPLTYTYGGESITIIPTYSPNDIMDAGSLRALCAELHHKQVTGEIDRDVFIFLNTDADSFLWEPMVVPAPLRKMPCFGGIGGYIDEVAFLDFVRFTTPGEYLRTHGPAGEVTFGEDVADGNLSGYMSWSEKPFNRLIWTRLERARSMARLCERDSLSKGFESRVRLLSTTHFGLASPVMNVTRESKALSLSEKMLGEEASSLPKTDTLTAIDPAESGLITAQLAVEDGYLRDITKLRLEADKLEAWTAVPMGEYPSGCISSIYLAARLSEGRREVPLRFSLGKPRRVKRGEIKSGSVSVDLDSLPYPSVALNGRKCADLHSWINYGGERRFFAHAKKSALPLAGDGSGSALSGEIHLDGEVESGSYSFEFFTLPGVDCVFVKSRVKYQYTAENYEINSQASSLGRYYDPKWVETAPFELTIPALDTSRVIKRSFAGRESGYNISDFWEAFPENSSIASINHQLTGGTLCIADEEKSVTLAHARGVLGSMAHCPMRLVTEGDRRELSLNPFGTYFGAQRHYPTRGNGSSMELYLAAAPQARSLAPAYNGAEETAIQAIFGADKTGAAAIADGAVILGEGRIKAFSGDNVRLHAAVGSKIDPRKLSSVTFGAGLIGLVRRYTENLIRAERRAKKLLKEDKKC
ncbi:MAG: hypothetical protein IJP67_07055 [Oscillospiraceae bacterium]|nr:hypothetical protein [Oscillospiraceae bacterium]